MDIAGYESTIATSTLSAHYLLREDPANDPKLEIFRFKKADAHLEVAEACYGCTTAGFFRVGQETFMTLTGPAGGGGERETLQLYAHPLLNYAARHWPEHARCASDAIADIFDLSSPSRQTILENTRNWLLPYSNKWGTKNLGRLPGNFTLVHLAACLDIPLLARGGWPVVGMASLEGSERGLGGEKCLILAS